MEKVSGKEDKGGGQGWKLWLEKGWGEVGEDGVDGFVRVCPRGLWTGYQQYGLDKYLRWRAALL